MKWDEGERGWRKGCEYNDISDVCIVGSLLILWFDQRMMHKD